MSPAPTVYAPVSVVPAETAVREITSLVSNVTLKVDPACTVSLIVALMTIVLPDL